MRRDGNRPGGGCENKQWYTSFGKTCNRSRDEQRDGRPKGVIRSSGLERIKEDFTQEEMFKLKLEK